MRRTQSFEIASFWKSKVIALIASSPPRWIRFKRANDGAGNFSKNKRYAWGDVCRRSSAQRITRAEYGGLPWGCRCLMALSSSKISLGVAHFLTCIPGRVNFDRGMKHFPGYQTGVWNILQSRWRGYETFSLFQIKGGVRKILLKIKSPNILTKTSSFFSLLAQ